MQSVAISQQLEVEMWALMVVIVGGLGSSLVGYFPTQETCLNAPIAAPALTGMVHKLCVKVEKPL